MRRIFMVGLLAVLVPSGLIGFRLWSQDWALRGPSGGSATIEGDRVLLASRVTARLASLSVQEGDVVAAGQVLAQLDCADPEAALAEARSRLASARAQAAGAEAQAKAAGVQTSTASAAATAARAQADALASQHDAADRQAKRVAALDDGTSPATVDQSASSADALMHQSDAASANARAAVLQIGLAKGNAAAALSAAEAAAEAVHAAEAGVRRAELMASECVITAPRAGVVETLPYEVGELVAPGTPIVALVDIDEVKATFYLPNAELAAATVGAEAELVADAWPDDVFRGHVNHIASEAAFTPRNVQTRTDRDRLVYPVEVTVPNADHRLRPGMPVQISLVGTDR